MYQAGSTAQAGFGLTLELVEQARLAMGTSEDLAGAKRSILVRVKRLPGWAETELGQKWAAAQTSMRALDLLPINCSN